MNQRGRPRIRAISPALIATVSGRLRQNLRVRRTLPDRGRVHIDRQLPMLCVYRYPPAQEDAGTARLVRGEASYLVASGAAHHHANLSALVTAIVETMSAPFGAFLLLEVSSAKDGGDGNDPAKPSVPPLFEIHAPACSALSKTVDAFAQGLRRICVLKQKVEVTVKDCPTPVPAAFADLVTPEVAARCNCFSMGVVVPPVYRDAETGRIYPHLLRSLQRSFGYALRQAFYEFSRSHTTHQPPHFHALGRRAVVKAVWDVDRQLSEVSNAFDFLLQLTPINSDEAWAEFERSGYSREPQLHYLPTPYDPAELKRRLYEIPIDRVEDPALQHIFQEKQEELDRKITLLRDRDTPRFLFGSLQLYGTVENDLVRLARNLLERSDERRDCPPGTQILDAHQFARRAQDEFAYYKAQSPEFMGKCQITRKVAGVMVSRGALLINPGLRVSVRRVDALLQHEVSTHLLTYFNGRSQPFRQLYSGLAGYEELQEGLAVLAEYLVGGLTRFRLRQLAARVISARNLIDGASFVDTFRMLEREFDLGKRAAFNTTMRTYRGGGLVKDAVYLRGLCRMLEHLRRGGALLPLFVGRVAVDHIPIIEELQFRKVLQPAPWRPRYLENPYALKRLDHLRRTDVDVLTLLNELDLPATDI